MNLHAFQVTYEQHVQTLIQDAVNSAKAYFNSAVQAMNNKADQVGRSTVQNEGMINVQTARIDDALLSGCEIGIGIDIDTRSSELEHWCNNSQGQHLLQERVERGEHRDEEWTCLPRLNTASEQVDELMVCVIEWIDEQRTRGDVTDADLHWWANGSVHNQLNLEWSLKQLYYLMNAKVVDGTRDIVRAEASQDNKRGARARQRVQVYAAGMTQNRRAELQSELINSK